MTVSVLVADSNAATLESLGVLFARRGFEVIATHDGGDALARFFEREPALVICHEALPVLSGASLCHQVKRHHAETRVIILSGGDGDAAAAETMRTDIGCDAVLFTPVNGESLDGFLEQWSLSSEVAEVANAEAPVDGAHFDGLGDDDFNALGLGEPGETESEAAAPTPSTPEPSAPEPSAPEAATESEPEPDPFGLAVPIPIPVLPVFSSTPEPEPATEPESVSLDAGPPAETPEAVAAPELELELAPAPEPALAGPGELQPASEPATLAPEPEAAAEPEVAPEPVAATESVAPLSLEPEPDLASVALAPEPDPALEPELSPETEPVEAIALGGSVADEAGGDLTEFAEAAPSPAESPLELVAAWGNPSLESLPSPTPPESGMRSPLDTLTDAPAANPVLAPTELPEHAKRTVFGEIADGMGALEESVTGFVEQQPEGAPELELTDLAEPVPRAEALAIELPSPPEPAAEPAPRVSPAQLRQSLPEPGVNDLPLDPAGSLGLRDDVRLVSPPGLPSAGDLETMPLPRLLYELFLSTFTGVLTLNSNGDRRRLFIWGGFPVRVESNQATENLGYMLLNDRRLTPEQYDQMEQKIRSDSLRAGDALRALGLLSDHEILDAMRRLNEERMVNTFAWRAGTYTYEARNDFADGTVFGEVHPLTVIWRGIHEHYDLSVLFEYFSSLRTRFIVTSRQFSVHYPALGPFLRNLNVKSILSGSTTFEDALRSDDSRAIELSQLLYFLLVTDMVKPQARPGEMPEELKEDIAVGSSSPAEAVDYRELARVSERIASEYLRLKDVDFFAALGLDHDADDNAIDRAFNEACAAFRYDRLPPGLGDDMLRKVREIIEILSRARVTLKDKAKRRGYEKESKVAAVMSFLEDDEPVPMDDNSRADALYQAGQGLLAEARFSEARVKFQEAIASFSHAARYWVALAQATLLDGHGEAATTDALNCLRRAYEAEPGDIAANFELAKLLLRVGQPQAARGHLQQVVERAPDHAEARRMLAQI